MTHGQPREAQRQPEVDRIALRGPELEVGIQSDARRGPRTLRVPAADEGRLLLEVACDAAIAMLGRSHTVNSGGYMTHVWHPDTGSRNHGAHVLQLLRVPALAMVSGRCACRDIVISADPD